jgi:DNA (cytosine-5)-methyltransferase 1
MQYHRGTVQKESVQTLDTQCHVGVVVDESKSAYSRNYGSKGKIQDSENVADTLQATMGEGGGNVPLVKNEIQVIGNYSPSNHDASRVVDSEGISPTVKENHGTITATIVNEINKNAKHQQDLVQSEEGSCRTIPAGTHASTPHLLKTIVSEKEQLRIRKLTPKECWRLMGFNDEEFEKAEKVNSNSQLYKQAGNSIVVNVLQKILENLLKGETNE